MNTRTVITIPKDQIAQLPIVAYPGTISIVTTQEQADAALEIILKSPIVGFDTETKPAFRKGQTNNVALMQVS
ncbi:MAG: 3'-5' exonuclease domain-containing protein 2, partial [Paramuribaculum sp.]|nr:3'-5' exonuclease domain-containing protein 2 [Paramuribaculum sp.]